MGERARIFRADVGHVHTPWSATPTSCVCSGPSCPCLYVSQAALWGPVDRTALLDPSLQSQHCRHTLEERGRLGPYEVTRPSAVRGPRFSRFRCPMTPFELSGSLYPREYQATVAADPRITFWNSSGLANREIPVGVPILALL